MISPRYWSVMAVAVLGCSLATPLPSPQARAGQDVADALGSALGSKAPATSFRVDVLDVPVADDGLDNGVEEDDPTRQLSPTTQSFLSTLGTALGPIVGAIVGPLLTNIGQNLSAGSGAQAITQLQQAAQAAVAAQQQQQQQQGGQGGNPAAAVAAAAAAAAALEISGSGPTSTTPSPSSPRPRPQTARPTRRPGARPSRPNARPTVDATSPVPLTASTAPPSQSFDAFVLDVPGRGPFLFLMTPNATAAEQSAAITQAQQQAAHLLAVDGQSSPIGAVASLIGTTPRPQVTKPTSVGPLPVHPVVSVTPPPPLIPLPSYHSLLDADELDQQGEEEVAVEAVEAPDHSDETHMHSDLGKAKEDDSDFSSQSFLERLFPEMV